MKRKLNILVCCSSHNSNEESINLLAKRVGEFIALNNHNIVMGACSKGMMGIVLDEVKKNPECQIFPKGLEAYYDDYAKFGEENPTSTTILYSRLGDRKKALTDSSDIAIILPGGIGTFDELFSSAEGKRAKEHNVPIFLINECGFFEPLKEQLETMVRMGFATKKDRDMFNFCDSYEELMTKISEIKD